MYIPTPTYMPHCLWVHARGNGVLSKYLYDKPHQARAIVRVAGPFTVESQHKIIGNLTSWLVPLSRGFASRSNQSSST